MLTSNQMRKWTWSHVTIYNSSGTSQRNQLPSPPPSCPLQLWFYPQQALPGMLKSNESPLRPFKPFPKESPCLGSRPSRPSTASDVGCWNTWPVRFGSLVAMTMGRVWEVICRCAIQNIATVSGPIRKVRFLDRWNGANGHLVWEFTLVSSKYQTSSC